MTSARHRQVLEHAPRPRLPRRALPATAAALVTGSVVAVAVAAGSHPQPVSAATTPAKAMTVTLGSGDPVHRAERTRSFSRSAQRVTRRVTRRVTLQERPAVKGRKFMTAPLNLWPAPKERGRPLDVLKAGGKVALTGVHRAGFAQILYAGQVRWVNQHYLADKMPKPVAPATRPASVATGGSLISSAPCASGSSVESGIVPQAVTLHRTVCAHFPQVTTYGGYRPDGEHADGHAVDIMIPDASTGRAVADWVRANAALLHVDNVIYAQHIWTTQRSSEGWRMMPDRGSTTANHYDHVHVRVF